MPRSRPLSRLSPTRQYTRVLTKLKDEAASADAAIVAAEKAAVEAAEAAKRLKKGFDLPKVNGAVH